MWRFSIQGRLAEIIILYQLSHNIYRVKSDVFSQNAMVLALA
ncbi:DUF924 domain-containing protein [Psychrobacter frigidicola]|uniref:DUF924 domain-containing protein n=1 Tax=Psychrobacter frigidicola TaxID=45611 RepID=A0A5C7ACW5_9GAMM|nr:DUF924 domain-containing protein [Psychrobacter frigidicola]